MTDDYVVSCWPVPHRKRGQKHSEYLELLGRIAFACDGKIDALSDPPFIAVGDQANPLLVYPGDTLCRRVSGRFGVKRGGR